MIATGVEGWFYVDYTSSLYHIIFLKYWSYFFIGEYIISVVGYIVHAHASAFIARQSRRSGPHNSNEESNLYDESEQTMDNPSIAKTWSLIRSLERRMTGASKN